MFPQFGAKRMIPEFLYSPPPPPTTFISNLLMSYTVCPTATVPVFSGIYGAKV
ncbi:hypothetical protein DSO57_1009701 [Entomophthora muscae]|uniref:Uncharacterized protein n=1 Tax=Entomophthora muscae TaxID=34485 RepID=A0ACC2TI08_9FUNG|nr:hypothetical protein DSO57_1009701 [Entomophthora muscae]